jgi:hypothetical protein
MGSAAPGSILLDTMVNAVKTAMILGALGLGIAAPSLLFQRDKLRS